MMRPNFWRRRVFGAVALLALGACHTGDENNSEEAKTKAPSSCLPVNLQPTEASIDSYHVYLDGSLSMKGYVEQPTSALADILRLIEEQGKQRNTAIGYTAFGHDLHPLADREAAARYAAPAAYECHGQGCDNQQSLIDKVLEDVADHGKERLNIVVTDLWLDDKAYRGSPEVALGTPLRGLIRNGMAIGVLGIDAPHAGPVYDVPGVGNYSGAERMPFYVLLIGTPAEVSRAFRTLTQSDSPALDANHTRYAMFTAAPIVELVRDPVLRATGGGVQQRTLFAGDEQTTEYAISLGQAASQQGKLAGEIDAMPSRESNALRPGLAWNGKLQVNSHWWVLNEGADLAQCRSDMWREATAHPQPWSGPSGATGASLALDAATVQSLRPAHYFVVGEIGAAGLYPDNPAAAWMRDWSLAAKDGPIFAASHPTTFRTLSLSTLADLMQREIAAQEQGPRALRRFAFVLTVDR